MKQVLQIINSLLPGNAQEKSRNLEKKPFTTIQLRKTICHSKLKNERKKIVAIVALEKM